ncbi:uncharacterized protein LOC134848811 [Symsagittifera roscoffensis]|uniref:uncharacterized protein LOC134848811 n=1 Tax=Symsagittifera roscoffensis TaxID=84072 RepID=UPI00307BBBD1
MIDHVITRGKESRSRESNPGTLELEAMRENETDNKESNPEKENECKLIQNDWHSLAKLIDKAMSHDRNCTRPLYGGEHCTGHQSETFEKGPEYLTEEAWDPPQARAICGQRGMTVFTAFHWLYENRMPHWQGTIIWTGMEQFGGGDAKDPTGSQHVSPNCRALWAAQEPSNYFETDVVLRLSSDDSRGLLDFGIKFSPLKVVCDKWSLETASVQTCDHPYFSLV